MGDRQYVIWAEQIDRKYEIGTTDARRQIPFGVEPIVTVDDIDLHMMTHYVKNLLDCGKSPKQISDECGGANEAQSK